MLSTLYQLHLKALYYEQQAEEALGYRGDEAACAYYNWLAAETWRVLRWLVRQQARHS